MRSSRELSWRDVRNNERKGAGGRRELRAALADIVERMT